jgi:signal transduction histidine kinase/response regulator of citrate/malate metabolism
MSPDPVEYQQILNTIPNTSLVLYDHELNILQVFDQDKMLENLFSGQRSLIAWGEQLDPFLQDDLMECCTKGLGGGRHHMLLDHPVGRITLMVAGLAGEEGKPVGVLFFQKCEGTEKAHEERLVRERNEAEESNDIKGRFLARISHEIRTPLNAIIGFVEQLQKTSLNPKQKNYVNIIDKSSVYLLDLVNEILAFSRLESGELKLDKVDFSLENLFHEIYETLSVRARDKSINLRLSIDERLTMICLGDAFRLKQVVINLVSNGIKFTEYGFVELGVRLLEEKNNQIRIRITVTDTGIGIPKHKLKEIFEEYKQATSGIARKHGGSGLGLTISHRLTKAMKGNISVESKVGKGSVFTVDLPLKRSEKEFLTKNVIRINAEELSGTRALLVDDDAMNRALGQIIMEGFNMEVSLANDGKEAMEVFEKEKFDVVLLDIHMPEVSGLEVAHFIRKHVKDRDVKIIAVTADILQEEEVFASSEEIDDVLIKPYREINLYNKICQVLEVESKILLKESVIIDEVQPASSLSYDLSELKQVTRGNQEFFNEMIDTFIENATEGMEQIANAFSEENWFEMQETAHRLIPSFKHLDIAVIVSGLVEIKSLEINQHNKSQIESLIGELISQTHDIIGRLAKEKYTGKPGAS